MRNAMESANEIITTALKQSARPAVTCSFQAEDVALVDLLRRQRPDIDVLFLDTGYHFAAVTEYGDRLAREWGLHLIKLRAAQSVEQQEREHGLLYRSDPGACCQARKVEPLMRGLGGYDAWFTGLRREQSPTRAELQPVEWHVLPHGPRLKKLNPLWDWSWSEVVAYLAGREIEPLALYAQGYTSIGCEPCTSVPAAGAPARSGRWGGRKLECGLHTVSRRESR